jgi:tetratricopeptide (TPR) repeat protein
MPEVADRITEAERLEDESRWREAMGVWRALADDEADARFLRRAALAAVQGDLMLEAEGLYREALQQEPKSAMGYFGLGGLLERCERLEEAQGLIQEGLRLEEAQGLINEGSGLEGYQIMLTTLGSVQWRLGNLEAARASLQRSLVLNPSDDEAHALLGLVEAKDDPVQAVEHFRKALELDPHLPDVHRELGYTLFTLGKNDEAERVLRQAVVEDPSDGLAHSLLGHVINRRGDWSGAKQEFLAAVTYEPGMGKCWRNLADACSMLDERQEAERYYLKALSLGVDDAFANARYGVFLKAQGEREKARSYLRRALDLNPNLNQAREVLSKLDDTQ